MAKKPKSTTPLKDRDDIEATKKEARATYQEIAAAETDQTWVDDMAAIDAARYPRIFSRWIDIDTLFSPSAGERIEISGEPSNGKSTLCYALAGTLLRTCRCCLTFAAAWLNEETGEIVETCRCGKNEFMEGILADIERGSDPVWLDLWGCRTGAASQMVLDPSKAFEVVKTQQKRLHILRPVTAGPMFTFIQKAVARGAVDFVIIDSINSLMTDEGWEKPAGQRTVGDRARMNWDGLRRIIGAQTRQLNKFGGLPTIIWTNHMIADIKSSWGGDVEAGGKGPLFFADQKIRFLFSKANEGKKDDLPFHSYRDSFFRVTKNKAGMASGGSGSIRMYLNDVTFNRVNYRPGDTDDAERTFALLRDLGLFDETKTKYRLLGREFEKVQEIKSFLSREDIALECRFWIGLLRMPTIARAHLDPKQYLYSPFPEMRKYYERTAEQVEKRFPALSLAAALGTREGQERDADHGSDAGGADEGGGDGASKSRLDAVFDEEPKPRRRARK